LRKGYIRPSKLPQIAPVFFVEKNDGKKRMMQDYWYLNEWTVKNNYPLLLILDVIENMSTKKIFTKIDLRQGYKEMSERLCLQHLRGHLNPWSYSLG